MMFKISIHLYRLRSENMIWSDLIRSEKLHSLLQRSNLQLHLSTVKIQLTSFLNPQSLKTISSGHDVIHTPASFPVLGFIMTNGDCHILSARAYAPWLRDSNSSKPYKTEWQNIINEKYSYRKNHSLII